MGRKHPDISWNAFCSEKSVALHWYPRKSGKGRTRKAMEYGLMYILMRKTEGCLTWSRIIMTATVKWLHCLAGYGFTMCNLEILRQRTLLS